MSGRCKQRPVTPSATPRRSRPTPRGNRGPKNRSSRSIVPRSVRDRVSLILCSRIIVSYELCVVTYLGWPFSFIVCCVIFRWLVWASVAHT